MWPALKSVSIYSTYLPPSFSFTKFNKPCVLPTNPNSPSDKEGGEFGVAHILQGRVCWDLGSFYLSLLTDIWKSCLILLSLRVTFEPLWNNACVPKSLSSLLVKCAWNSALFGLQKANIPDTPRGSGAAPLIRTLTCLSARSCGTVTVQVAPRSGFGQWLSELQMKECCPPTPLDALEQ